jgi:septal ring factor EnvC (AmiA/AmiB activator)
MGTLKNQAARSETQSKELESLQAQLDTEALQREKVQRFLAENEKALAEMDQAIAAIGDMKTATGRNLLDMESAMAELARIASRAKEYA